MNKGLRNELTVITGLTAVGFLLSRKPKWAVGAALCSLGLRAIPVSGFSFQNKSVVITGGSRGLGLALAEQLVEEGALVTLLARDLDELQRAAQQLDALRGVPVFIIGCDVTHRSQLKSAFQKVQEHFGRIDILIHNAGTVSAGPFEAMSQADFEAQMNLHFYAVLKSVQLILPIFSHQGGGRIVNICSIGGKIPIPHMAPYCATKFALAGLSQTLGAELEKNRISVTTVYPGLMRTGSPIQGVFKGDHEKEFAWFALFDSIPGISMSAQKAAKKILSAVRSGQREVVISIPAKLGVFTNANFPEVFQQTMKLINRFLPQSLSTESRTGAASRHWLDRQTWARPFLGILQRAQHRFNEHEKFDADFNLNLRQY